MGSSQLCTARRGPPVTTARSAANRTAAAEAGDPSTPTTTSVEGSSFLPAGTIAGHTADLWPAGALGLRTEDEIRREMSSRVNLSAAVVEEIF